MPAADAIDYLAKRDMKGFMVDSAGGIWVSKSLKPDLGFEDSSLRVTFK
jgi:hypothetical protein